jgi:cell division transport system permease protein
MKRQLKVTSKHILRSPFQSLAAILVLILTFFLSSSFIMILTGSYSVARYFSTRPQVIAFLKDSADEIKINELKTSLQKLSGVSGVIFTSKNEALDKYRKQNEKDPLLLEMVTSDILPASLEVRSSDPGVLPQIAEILKTQDIVEEVSFHKDIVDNLNKWSRAIKLSGIGLVSSLIISSLCMVFIVIGMKIANRKAEIEIVRLLGGSGWQVISSFVYEGVTYGVIGATTGWLLSWLALLYTTSLILDFFGTIPVLPAPTWFLLTLLGGQILTGIFIGFFSSVLAAKRFLR